MRKSIFIKLKLLANETCFTNAVISFITLEQVLSYQITISISDAFYKIAAFEILGNTNSNIPGGTLFYQRCM